MIAAMLFAVDIGDPDSTRTVWAIVALLVVMGIGLVMLAFWLRRSTRPDPEFLAPLELMGERAWRRGDPVWQRRRLDEVRPDDAAPLQRPSAPPRLDETFDDGPSGTGFDDLHDDAHPEPVDRPDLPMRHTPPQTPMVERDDGGEVAEGDDGTDEVAASGVVDAADGVAYDDGDEDVDPTETPVGASRPYLDDLPQHEIDPEELRRAMEQLDAELQRNPDD